jgi:hypothetical protein
MKNIDKILIHWKKDIDTLKEIIVFYLITHWEITLIWDQWIDYSKEIKKSTEFITKYIDFKNIDFEKYPVEDVLNDFWAVYAENLMNAFEENKLLKFNYNKDWVRTSFKD